MASTSHQSSLSRLDRVFTLLENGASPVTRKAAAKQLGDVQKKHPHELNNLLAKLLVYICHNEWDARIGAAEAIEAVVSQVPLWNPEPQAAGGTKSSFNIGDGKLTFTQFDVDKILSGSQPLLGSSGDEYKLPVDVEGLSAKERVKKQRAVLERQLGLTMGQASLGVTSDDLFQDSDLIVAASEIKAKKEIKKEIKQDCTNVIAQFSAGMSSRERNLAKRKAKLMLKQQSREVIKQENNDAQPSKKRKKNKDGKPTGPQVVLDDIPKHPPLPEEWTEWPFNWICDELMNLLFNPCWESRHGACLALREIIKKQGKGCGKEKMMNRDELNAGNQTWLADLAIRLLCVIALDRFADFVSDQAVAPVRESCAQTLSVVSTYLEQSYIFEVIKVLLHLYSKDEWEVRQSAMLVLQYIVAVRKDLASSILPLCFPTIVKGLHDRDGDVRSVSAKALMPTAELLTENSGYDQQLQLLLSILWRSLQDYDELTSSTQSVLVLLSKLIQSLPLDKICRSDRPENLLSRLWPFFLHALASVREAALSTAITILSGCEGEKVQWLSSIALNGLLHAYQCCLLEPKFKIRALAAETFSLLVQKSPVSSLLPCAYHALHWIALSCQPSLTPYEPSKLISSNAASSASNEGYKEQVISGWFSNALCADEYEEYLMKTRELTASMIGLVCSQVFDHVTSDDVMSALEQVKQHLAAYLTSQAAVQRIVALVILSSWWENTAALPPSVSSDFHNAVIALQTDCLFYNEVSIKFMQVQADMKCLLNTLTSKGFQVAPLLKPSYSFEDVIEFCTEYFSTLVASNMKDLFEQKDLLLKLAEDGNHIQNQMDCRVKSYAANVLVNAVRFSADRDPIWKLPEKLNPVIRPLMECIKKEDNPTVRSFVSATLSRLVGLCANRQPNPNNKLIKNLCSFLRCSTVSCPTAESMTQEFSDDILKSLSLRRDVVATDGLLTQLRRFEASKDEAAKKKKKGSSEPDNKQYKQTSSDIVTDGATTCLQTMCRIYEVNLFNVLPQLFNVISALKGATPCVDIASSSDEHMHSILQAVVTLNALVPAVNYLQLQETVISLLPHVISLVWSKPANVRFICARCIASYSRHMTVKAIPIILEEVLCKLDISQNLVCRKGAVECVANVIEAMGTSVVCYAVLLVVPLLGCMSDQDTQVRLLATHCFAQLIQYMPVESSIPDPPDLPPSLVEKKNKERLFLEQLFDPNSLQAYKVAVPINAKLRSYQEDGVKWLAFLNRYKLHGVLCDEMGLGKTLQTICIVASDHHNKIAAHQCENPGSRLALKSLIICPPTLTGHWVDEVKKFCDYLTPLQYAGTPQERSKLQNVVRKYDLIIASYDVVRNDFEFFSKFKWNYCVLDEGHAIRNGKNKTSQCIKLLSSNHRLILTGTPIQNSVLELWSLFDFLMPGFLGTEQEFNVAFTKPIVASRDAKSSSKEQENGVIAMEALHRQVLPFMLRRMKDDVLKDLPPKIIQDYYCELSALQLELYEDFARSRAKKDAESSINTVDEERDMKSRSKGASHVFEALQYLQKVCNHPALVLIPSHPQYKSMMMKLKSMNSALRDIKHATKLIALNQLLLDCGIGVTSDDVSEQSVANQHRALVFCQHRNMLDIIENDLLRVIMPTVTFLRLDGSVPANQRFSIVSQFNGDPSIDLLLLTTKVGGLGLNLTGADTVIFVEHDWNPMVDLQAMDRAHRIGQKKVVNVYRLITRGTLEEKVLGLQKFKLNVANTVVGEDNRRLQSMGTSQVLELFTVDTDSASKKKSGSGDASTSKGLRAMMENLGELWDQNQYDDEYNLDNFIQTLAEK